MTPLYCELRDLGPRRLFFPAAGDAAAGDEGGAGTTAPCASAGGPRSAARRPHASGTSGGGDPFEVAVGAAAASSGYGKGKSWRVTMGDEGVGEQPSSSGVPPSRSNRKKPPPTTPLELEVAEAEPGVGDSALRSSTMDDSSSGPAAGDRARDLPAPASSSSSLAAAASGRGGHAGATGGVGGGGGHGGGHPETKGTARWDVRGPNGIAGEANFCTKLFKLLSRRRNARHTLFFTHIR